MKNFNVFNCVLYSIGWTNCPFPSEEDRVETCILHYRAIYCLNNVCNAAFGKLIIPFVKLAVIIAFILSFFAFVRLHKELEIISLAFITTVVFTSVLLLGPIAVIMSSLFDMSSKFCFNLSLKAKFVTDLKARKILERDLKACPLIRSQVGGLYHMEAKAKLTMIHNVVDGVAYLLVNL